MQTPQMVLQLPMRVLPYGSQKKGGIRASIVCVNGETSEGDSAEGAKGRAMERQAHDYDVMFKCPIYCEDRRKQCGEPVRCSIDLAGDRMEFAGACPHVNAPEGSTIRLRLEGEAEYLVNLCTADESMTERREAVYGREALPPIEDRNEV